MDSVKLYMIEYLNGLLNESMKKLRYLIGFTLNTPGVYIILFIANKTRQKKVNGCA